MISVTTQGAKPSPRQKNGTFMTIRHVLVLIFVTSSIWFTLDLVVIHVYNNQRSAADNHKLPLDGGDSEPLRDTDDTIHMPVGRNVERGVLRYSKNVNRTGNKEPKPKLARLLGKRGEGGTKRLEVVPQDTREVAAKDILLTEKITTTEGFHLIEAIDVTSFPRNHSGLGEGGVAVETSPDEKKLVNDQWNHNYFNEYLSDRISVERSIYDHRYEECNDLKVSNRLPRTSVIMCFCEESWSTVLRSVHSVINRSPPDLLEEILLIDDFSQREHLKEPLDKYMAKFPIVKVVHLKERHGLVRARLVGVEMSKASVLTFLDSHIECMVGWLEPLLQRVHEDRRNVVCPTIDLIDPKTFQYSPVTNTDIGSFSWSFSFIWGKMSDREKKRRKRLTSPIRSPTMAGGLFSIDKKFFYELGLYDKGFEVWGAENLELSFKTWMCGGQIEILPCSRVGHIFRLAQPYSFPDHNNIRTFHINTMRMVEVWVDDPYKQIFYDAVPSMIGMVPGDLTDRKAIRQMLQCKDFQWYLDNVHPRTDIPEFVYRARGMVRNAVHDETCLDTMKGSTLGAFDCHGSGLSQLFFYTTGDVITNSKNCYNPEEDGSLVRGKCDLEFAGKYTHESGGPIVEKASGKCLELIVDSEEEYIVKLEPCDGKGTQRWNWEHYYDEKGVEI